MKRSFLQLIRIISLLLYTYGLFTFSLPIVVAPICPGNTFVSSGSRNNFSLIERISAEVLLVAKSLLPKYSLFFYIVGYAALGMSRCMDHPEIFSDQMKHISIMDHVSTRVAIAICIYR